jgi:DNA replication and repair protein RecF
VPRAPSARLRRETDPVLVRRVRMTNLRSRRGLDVQLGPGLTILVGPNGAGKTTVLEATALVLEGSPMRANSVRDLITRGEDHLRVEVDLEQDGAILTAAAAYSRDGERRLTADGAPLEDSSRWRDALPVRTFVPDDLRLIKGSPRRRREYLDALAGRREPEYLGALRRYEEALAQRNMLLRTVRGGGEGSQFVPWESILAQTGIAVSRWRAATLASFVASFQRTHAELTGDPPDSLRLVYRTNVAGLDEEGYRARLAETRDGDRQRTYTHLGPHRDDLRLTRGGLDVRDCASQGEQRAALLTLVLAEWEYLCATPRKPLLLLDDVMSELDEGRRSALVALVRRGGQTVITTTDLRYFSPEELREAAVVELEAGDEQPGKEQDR